jgi:hypothetical protein
MGNGEHIYDQTAPSAWELWSESPRTEHTMTHAASLTEDPKCAITPEDARHETIQALALKLEQAVDRAIQLATREGIRIDPPTAIPDRDAAHAAAHLLFALYRAQEALRDYDAVSA